MKRVATASARIVLKCKTNYGFVWSMPAFIHLLGVRTVSCPPPPPAPPGGDFSTLPPVPSVQTHTACNVQRGSIQMTCPSFLNIVIMKAVYGRLGGEEELCDGGRGRAPDQDCLTPLYLTPLQRLCQGQQECSWGVPLNLAVCPQGIKAQVNLHFILIFDFY